MGLIAMKIIILIFQQTDIMFFVQNNYVSFFWFWLKYDLEIFLRYVIHVSPVNEESISVSAKHFVILFCIIIKKNCRMYNKYNEGRNK